MLSRLTEIRSQITSDDKEVLRHSLGFVQERLREEQDRGKAAETRAVAVLAFLGILASLIVPFAATIYTVVEGNRPLLYVIFATSILYLLRGIYYALRILGVNKQYRLTPESVYDFQPAKLVDVLRDDLAATIWLYDQVKEPNTRKLFWLDRAQRSGAMSIFFYVFFGVTLLALREELVTSSVWIICGAATLGILGRLLDWLVESGRFGIWRRS